MIEQLKTFESNVLAIEVIDDFTETDEMLCRKLFEEKLAAGADKVNVLVKLDELKTSKISMKAFFEDVIWTWRNYKKMRHLAIVAHSSILKALVPVDNLFYENKKEERLEKYFDVSQLNEAFDFVQS